MSNKAPGLATLLVLCVMAGSAWVGCPLRAQAAEATGSAREEVTAQAHRLAGESSPYLLQHVDNPVDWYPWGEEAFDKARGENKLIFLSVGYSSCYWCHVMERRVFTDPEVAETLNRDFVSILVDREERPDIDRIYMTVRMAATGGGGWPLSVFLTPERKPLFAGGYLPKERFIQALNRIETGWRTQEQEYRRHAERVLAVVRRSQRLPGEPVSQPLPQLDLAGRATAAYRERFDYRYGGFGSAPKFPQSSILEFLMTFHQRTGDHASLAMVTKTLHAMAAGGIHDHLGGGFHRYATDHRWRVPHFEKMLYDNAQLLRAYVRAYGLTADPAFRGVAEAISDYVTREMTAPTGLFYAALDSETEEEEGTFYLWRRDELSALLSPSERSTLLEVYELTPLPASPHKAVLHVADSREATSMLAPTLSGETLRMIRAKLLSARETRPRPFVDDKAIAAWNGLMIEAFALSGSALGRERDLRLAERAAHAALRIMVDKQVRLRHVANGETARIPAYLADYGAMILGLTQLYRSTGNLYWRSKAAHLADVMLNRLHDVDSGALLDTEPGTDLIVVPRDSADGAMPAGNSLAARALTGLAATGLDRFAPPARSILSTFVPTLTARPDSLPYMLAALEEIHRYDSSRPTEVIPLSTSDVVQAAAWLAQGGQSAAGPRYLTVSLDIEDGWHVNADTASFDFLIPTRLSARIGSEVLALEPAYPAGTTLETPLGAWLVFGDETTIRSALPTDLLRDGGSALIELEIEAQACNDAGTCLTPATVTISMSL